MSYVAWSVVFGEQPTAAKWNQLGGNDADAYARQNAIQSVLSTEGAADTGTTVIPFDNTIPQNTEGTEFMTASITPTNASNKLVIDAQGVFAHTANPSTVAMCLFRDSTANALAVIPGYFSAQNVLHNIKLRFEVAAGSVSATTFKIRAGSDQAGTLTFNGTGGGGYFNGTLSSYINVREVKA